MQAVRPAGRRSTHIGAFAQATPSTPEREGLALSSNIEIITRFEHAFRG
jgi:hypothetical protein